MFHRRNGNQHCSVVLLILSNTVVLCICVRYVVWDMMDDDNDERFRIIYPCVWTLFFFTGWIQPTCLYHFVSLVIIIFFFTLAKGLRLKWARVSTGKQPTQAGRKFLHMRRGPIQVEKEPAQVKRNDIPRIQIPDIEVITDGPFLFC